MGQWLQLTLALLYKLLDVVARAVLGQLTYIMFFFHILAVSSTSRRNSCIEETLPSFSLWIFIQRSSFLGSLKFKSQLQRQWAWASQVSLQGASSSPQRKILHVQKAMSKSLSSFGSHCSLVASELCIELSQRM